MLHVRFEGFYLLAHSCSVSSSHRLKSAIGVGRSE
jgi:hypothetical protein